jgi:hypothetical protein
MKTILKLTLAIAAFAATASFVSCKDVIVTVDKLPAAAQAFLKEVFPESSISYVKKDKELTKTTYEVVFQDGSEVEFDSKGNWDNVDCKRSAVPASLVPEGIEEYVQTNFPGQAIVKIDKEPYGHEIELISDLELKFDKKGKLITVDD